MSSLLEEAEALEGQAAEGRVAYFSDLLEQRAESASTLALLDIGCGNGYSVAKWRERGLHGVRPGSLPISDGALGL